MLLLQSLSLLAAATGLGRRRAGPLLERRTPAPRPNALVLRARAAALKRGEHRAGSRGIPAGLQLPAPVMHRLAMPAERDDQVGCDQLYYVNRQGRRVS